MSDLISRSALMEELARNSIVKIVVIGEKTVWDIVKDQPTIEAVEVKHDGWIPCSERLPDATAYYYVTSLFKGEPKRYTAKFDKGKKRWSLPGEPYYEVPVIAWYPLPEPYQPKGE